MRLKEIETSEKERREENKDVREDVNGKGNKRLRKKQRKKDVEIKTCLNEREGRG